MLIFKIPHPLWHCLFTTWAGTLFRAPTCEYGDPFRVFHEFSCSRCKLIFEVEVNEPQSPYPRKAVHK